jgi:hypothetical protein
VVRNPEKISERHENLTVRAGNVTDTASVAEITTGADAVIISVSPPRGPGAEPGPATAALGESVVAALRSLGADAPRLVVVGGAGSLEVAPGARLVDTPDFPDIYKAEALAHAALLGSFRTVDDLDWSYLSPSAVIAPGERTGVFRLADDTLLVDAEGNSFISAEDFVIALVDEAEEQKHLRRRFTVGY